MNKLATYVINLDTATERMERMHRQLTIINLPYQRVCAIMGDHLGEPITNFSSWGYKIRTGKKINKREIGCYFSHLQLMRQFLDSDAQHALILEDDATLPVDFADLLDSLLETAHRWDMVRLSSSRDGSYRLIQKLGNDCALAINTRVLKNTAAYLLSREGAKRCLQNLQPMCRPYDVALDRDWDLGIRTACVIPFPVGHGDVPGQIPKVGRIQPWRSTTFQIFHLIDHLMRRLYRCRVYRRIMRQVSTS